MSDQFQNKLFHYAPEPPQKVWDAIDKALDEMPSTLSQKLYNYGAAPPPDAWNKIETRLSTKTPARVIPFFKNKAILRYSAAAAVLLAVVFATLQTGKRIDPTSISNEIVNTQTPPAEQTVTPLQPDSNNEAAATMPYGGIVEARSIAAKKLLKSRLHPRFEFGSIVSLKKFFPQVAKEKQTVTTEIPLEKYMVYSDGDGNAMKLPKKLFDFIACVKEDVVCKQQMQQLQQQFAATGMTTDFTGILDIVKNLKENQ